MGVIGAVLGGGRTIRARSGCVGTKRWQRGNFDTDERIGAETDDDQFVKDQGSENPARHPQNLFRPVTHETALPSSGRNPE